MHRTTTPFFLGGGSLDEFHAMLCPALIKSRATEAVAKKTEAMDKELLIGLKAEVVHYLL